MQNSSLVLTSDTRTRDSHEPSGEPESLWGRMPGKMGDRVLFGKPELLDERKKKLREKYRVTFRTRVENQFLVHGRQAARKELLN